MARMFEFQTALLVGHALMVLLSEEISNTFSTTTSSLRGGGSKPGSMVLRSHLRRNDERSLQEGQRPGETCGMVSYWAETESVGLGNQ